MTNVSRGFEATFSNANGRGISGSNQDNSSSSAAHVRKIISDRRERDKFLPAHLFADAAWDMLLELYAAELEQVRLSTTSLCDASHVPATTALRWITALVNEGLADRHPDPLDARRVYVRLSFKGLNAMSAYFQAKRS